MYNRYIGNTGKVIRMEESPDGFTVVRGQRGGAGQPRREVGEQGRAARSERAENRPLAGPDVKKPVFGGIAKLFDSVLPFGRETSAISLPFGLETGDLILLALFLFLYMESKDEEFLIILGFLAYSFFKERKVE